MGKNLPADAGDKETWVQYLGWEDPLEKSMAIHFSTLAWRIPQTEELGRLQSWGHKESDMTKHAHQKRREWYEWHTLWGQGVSRSLRLKEAICLTLIQKDTCTPMLAVVKTQKQPTCPSMDERTNKR